MKTISGRVIEEVGFHARPATLAVIEAMKYKSDATLHYNDNKCNLKSLISVMKMQVPNGANIEIEICGEDEETASIAICDLLEKKSIMKIEKKGG